MNKPFTENATLQAEALAGLRADPKILHPKWFYDSVGSDLFEQITELPEYYLTRTELRVLQDHVAKLAPYIPKGSALIELGSGASTKTHILLGTLEGIQTYVPVDISREFLHSVAEDIDRSYPALRVEPLAGDLLEKLDLPDSVADCPKVGFFPGSTLGNLEAPEARALLRRVRAWPKVAAFVLGIDLVKDPQVLLRAYDDAQGVTAAFNRNVLHRLNREAGADFDVDAFRHEARWNADKSRIEMHLVSRWKQQVRLGADVIDFADGESIHTESSHKYTPELLKKLAADTGWHVAELLTDEDAFFAVAVLAPADPADQA